MAKYSINDTTLKAIADPLRTLLGLTGGMTPEEMASNGEAVQVNVTAALAMVASKGVTVPAGADSDDLASLIAQIITGGGGEDLSAELSEQATIIADLERAIAGKAAGGGDITTETWVFTMEDGSIVEKQVDVRTIRGGVT